MMNTTGNAGLDALADAIAERVYQRLEAAQGKHRSRFLSITDAAEYIGPSAIRHMIAKGILPSVRRDGRVYLDREDLDTWIEMGKTRG